MLSYKTLSSTNYIELVVNLISRFEGHIPAVDDIGDSRATIGYGYTFGRSNNVELWTASGISLSAAEWSILRDIDEADPSQRTSLALERFKRTLTKSEAVALLRQTYSQYEGPANELAMPLSEERAAFVSLTYNRGVGAVQRKMRDFFAAVSTGNRAEAWYQIRYNAQTADKRFVNGIAARRYAESQTFGLYEATVSGDSISEHEAIQVYQMYTRHREHIFRYELRYSSNTSTYGAYTLEQSLDRAAQCLKTSYIAGIGLGIDVNALDIQVGSDVGSDLIGQFRDGYASGVGNDKNDLILGMGGNDQINARGGHDVVFGGDGDDIVQGREGDDVLFGGSGADFVEGGDGDDHLSGGSDFGNVSDGSADTLSGGRGLDIYVACNADVVVDEGGEGQLLFKTAVDGEYLLGAGISVATEPYTWSDANGITYVFVPLAPSEMIGTLRVTRGAEKVEIQNFNLDMAIHGPNGFLGIRIPQAVVLTSSSSAGVFATLEAAGSTATTTLTKGALQTFTASVLAASNTERLLTIALSGGSASDIKVVTGAEVLSFNADGTVTLTIAVGQTSLSFALLCAEGPTQTTALQLSATLLPLDASQDSVSSNALTVDVSPTPNGDAGDLVVIAGTLKTDPETLLQYTEYRGDGANDLITTGDGLNAVILGNGDNVIDDISGGAVIGGTVSATYDSDGRAVLAVSRGGDGANLITLHNHADVVAAGNGHNRIYGDSVIGIPDAILRAKGDGATHQRGAFLSAGDGNNTIIGSLGDDAIYVGAGNNFIVTGPGNTTILGGVEVDRAEASWHSTGATNASLLSGIQWHPAAYTTPDGGRYEGNIQMTGLQGGVPSGTPFGTGNNTIFGGSGASHIALSNGDNYVDAGSGNSTISGGMGRNTIFGGTGNIVMIGGGGDDYVYTESGNDTIYGNGGNNTIIGGTGNNLIYAGGGYFPGTDFANYETGNNYVYAGSGSSTIYGSGGSDTLIGGAGDDVLIAGDGAEYVVGGDGNNQIQGGRGNDTLVAGGNGNNTIVGVGSATSTTVIYGGDGVDLIQGGSGETIIYAGSGGTEENPTLIQASQTDAAARTTVYGGLGIERIYGGPGQTVIYAGQGDALISTGSGNATVLGGSGTYTIFGGSGTNILHAGDGGSAEQATIVIAGSGQATLFGGAGFAQLQDFQSGRDVLVGGSGQTTLLGSGHDTLVAGSGTTSMVGDGGGGLTFQINPGSGDSYLYGLAGDRLDFGVGSEPELLTLWATLDAEGRAALAIWGDGGTTIAEGGLIGSIGSIAFGDSESMGLRQLIQRADVIAEVIQGSRGEVVFSVMDGEEIVAGTGQDTISAWGDNDTLVAGGGGDYLYAVGDHAVLIGGAGNDTLVANGGNDTLVASAGTDLLKGSAAGATYIVTTDFDNCVISATGGTREIRFGSGIALNDLSVGAIAGSDEPDLDIRLGQKKLRIESVAVGAVLTAEFVDGTRLAYTREGGGVRADWTRPGDIYGNALYYVDGSATSTTYGPDGSYAIAVRDVQGTTVTTEYDRDGRRLKAEQTNPDGSVTTTSYRADGSYTTAERDAAGNTLTAEHDQSGRRLSDEWTKVDGSYGVDAFSADGSSTGSAHYPDGTSSTYTDDGHGHKATTYYNAAGIRTGEALTNADGSSATTSYNADSSYSVAARDAQGNAVTTYYDRDGVKRRDEWTRIDGSHGSDVFGTDGSSSGSAHYPNGTSSSYTNDGHGNTSTTYHDAAGTVTSEAWTKTDGSYGNTVFNPDGSSSTVVHNADGSSATSVDDGHGNVHTTTYDAQGQETGDHWTFANGNYAVETTDAAGTRTWTIYSENGTKLGDSWSKTDGSHGRDTFYSDGSSSGGTYYSDGSYSTYSRNERGQLVTRNYAYDGAFMGSTVSETFGYGNTVTSRLDSAGNKISETFVHADGFSGSDVVTSYDFDGTLNMVLQDSQINFRPRWEVDHGALDGAYGWNSGNVNGNALERSVSELWIPAGPASSPWSQASYLIAGQNNGATFNASYEIYDASTGVDFYVSTNGDGWKHYDYSAYYGGSWHSFYWQAPLQYAVTLTIDGKDGTQSTLYDDGLGNVQLISYGADGRKLDDIWFQNDGVKGYDVFYADGSSTGFSVDPDTRIHGYSRDGDQVDTFEEDPDAPLPPPPAPSQPPSNPDPYGPPQRYNGQGWDDFNWNWATGELIITEYGDNGDQVSKTTVDTDPGFKSEVAINGLTTGWNYDAAGVPVSRYLDDGQGTVTTHYYDDRGQLTGSSVATTDDNGSTNTRRYAASGELFGTSSSVTGADGVVTTSDHDASGALTGRTTVTTDGNGNSVTATHDAAGTLVSRVTKVFTQAGELVISHYDRSGNPTSIVVSTANAECVVTSNFYDGEGHFTSATVMMKDSAGNPRSAYYDASGTLTNYVTVRRDDDGDVEIVSQDATGVRLRESVLSQDGVFATTTRAADGSSVRTEVNLDRSYSVATNNGHGDAVTSYYSSTGEELRATWTRADGSSGEDIFAADGTRHGTIVYANHTTAVVEDDGQGVVTTTHYAADGTTSTGSTVERQTPGRRTITTFDAAGTKLSETWTDADGSSGTTSFEPDGTTSGTTYDISGTERANPAQAPFSTSEDNGYGQVTTRNYDAAGNLLGSAVATSDSLGTVTTRSFDPQGTLTQDRVDDGHGNVTTTRYGNDDVKLSDTWTRSDGRHGEDLFNTDGSSSGSVHNPDGTHSTYTNDGNGLVVTTRYDVRGNVVSVQDTLGNTLTNYYDASGRKTNDSWSRADGSWGNDTFNADGSSGHVVHNPDGTWNSTAENVDGSSYTNYYTASNGYAGYASKTSDGYLYRSLQNADGSRSWYREYSDGSWEYATRDVQGNETWNYSSGYSQWRRSNTDGSYSWSEGDGFGNSVRYNFNTASQPVSDSWVRSDGRTGSTTYNPDWSGTGFAQSADGTYATYTIDGDNNIATQRFDAAGNLTGTSSTYYDSDWNPHTTNSDGSSVAWIYNEDWSFDLIGDDGAGNTVAYHFDEDGLPLSERWTHSDGSSGIRTYHLDGTVTAAATYEDGRTSSSTDDGQGHLTTQYFSPDGNLVGTTDTSAVGQGNLRALGSTDRYVGRGFVWFSDGGISFARGDQQGNSIAYQFNTAPALLSGKWSRSDGSEGVDVYCADGSRYGSVSLDDGSAMSYANDGYGEVARRYLDSSGNLTRSEVETTSDHGDLMLVTYDSSGRKTGDQWSHLDGRHGSDSFSADGASAGTAYRADGSYSKYTDDGHGNVVTTDYDAHDVRLGDVWRRADGSYGSDTYNADGSYSSTVNDGRGNSATSHYNSDGVKIRERWISADGSNGNDYFAAGPNERVVAGDEAPNRLYGRHRGDTLVGGASPNVFVVDANEVVVDDESNNGTDVIRASVSYTLSGNVANLVLTGTGNLRAAGNDEAHTLVANSGNSTLVAGAGLATLIGGTGNNTFRVNKGDDVVEDAYATDTDIIESSASYSLPENVSTLRLTGSADLVGIGNAGDHVLIANVGSDTLIAGSGRATLIGGARDDTFVVNKTEDVVLDGYSGDHDVIESSASYTLVDNIGTLRLTGSDDLVATGNDGDHTIIANSGNDTLIAGTGLATLIGGAGSDTFVVNNVNDVVRDDYTTGSNVIQSSVSFALVDNVNRLELTGTAGLVGTGNDARHVMVAGAGNDTLIAGAGIATLIGGAGDNTFVINNVNDVVHDAYTEDDDVIESSASYVLPANVNTLILTGTADLSGAATGGNNRIIANSGNATLISGSGVDTLLGGSGNNSFVINGSADLVEEAAGQGRDTLYSSVSYVLPQHVEELVLTGTGNLTATGNDEGHVLIANAGNDTLIAGTGLATLIGGAGSDTFVVNNVNDVVRDGHAGGNNVIQSSVSFALVDNVNTLILTGNGDLIGTGNADDHMIVGNAGNDTLIAGSGNATLVAGSGLATLIGGAGSDTFIVNRTGDVVLDDYTTGNNVIESSVSYVLPTNVDTLILTGTAQLTGIGNAGDDLIVANDAGNTLVSGTGTDTLQGGAGSDVFVVNNTGDIVEDSHTTGNNVIETSVNYVLPDHVNTLLLSGSGNLSVSGNAANNLIIGNAGNDTLASGGGNDTLAAGSGVATLIGGAGNDTFIVNHASDVVQDSDVGDTNVILSSASYVLPTNVSTLILTGSANLSATGNSARGLLVGNAGNHTLTAGSGGDTLVAGSGLATLTGGAGSDVFIINNTSDVVRDSNAAAGNVLVASASYTLPTNVNTLVLTGSGDLVGTGNDANNLIYGNAGNSTLNGGWGVDTLVGGSGNDFFIVNGQDDVVISGPNQGEDTIRSSDNYTLPENVRTLILADAFGGTTATGNSQDHILMATVGDVTLPGGFDTLNAGSGKAILYGGTGQTNHLNALHNSAALIGGTGNNWFSSGNYCDFIGAGKKGTPANFDWIKTGASTNVIAVNGGDGLVLLEPTAGCSNTLSLGGGIDTGSLTFNKVNTDLILTDTLGDTIRFTNWYGGTSQHSVTKLQVMEFASALYDSNSANPLTNRKVYEFDFNALVAAFDQARVANPLLLNWSLTGALPSALIAASDTTAIGGDLAYAYASNGFSSLETDTVFEALGSSDFAMTAQAISAWQSLQPESDPGTTTQSDSGSSSESSTEPVNYVTAEQMPSIWDFMNTRLNDLLLAGPAGGATTLDAISQEVAGLQTVATQVLSAVQADSALLQQRSAHA